MKVRIDITVDIDPEVWTLTYGVEGAREMRADVRSWAESLVRDALALNGTGR